MVWRGETLSALKNELARLRDPEKAKQYAGYFKTGPGEYGHGDVFLGISTPVLRKLARAHRALPFDDVAVLLKSGIHEHRSVALMILVEKYGKAAAAERESVVRFYLDHLDQVNNWDLVDGSAPYILGPHLFNKDASLLDEFARSEHLWRRRIAIVATQYFIRQGRFDDTLRIAESLLKDKHELIHKAVGWMLREVGKKDQDALESFLRRHADVMPRTMLRYAIERFPEAKRKMYLGMKARNA
jgi:3-methyladenine DNA glycosylase AlkD